jgi:hypothetical protein
MKRLLIGLAVLPFLAGVSLAAQPVPLTDTQMDKVTAGFDFHEREVTNTGVAEVWVDITGLHPCAVCYLHVAGTPYPSGAQSLEVTGQFGP